MAPLPDYVAGTITLTNGDTAFTGSGTGWLAAGFREGDTILGIEDNEGVVYVVESITDNDAGTLTQPWQGVTGTYTYRMRYLSDGQRVTAQARQLIELLGNGNLAALAGLDGTPSTLPMFTGTGAMIEVPRTDLVSGVAYDVQVDTLADRDAYDGQPEGFSVLVADIGDGRAAVYSRIASGWSDPAYVTGPVGPMPEVTVGSTTTGAPGTDADVTPTPIPGGIELDFTIPAGEGFSAEGDYDSGTAYVKGDVVQQMGSSWIALQATTGNAPPTLPTTSNAYWQLLARAGNDGAGTVTTVSGGTGISVDTSDPTDPVVSLDDSATVTALLNVVVGDSGAGGTKGLVPAPAAGDAAAGKFLAADGTWTEIEQGGYDPNIALLALEVADLKGERLGMVGGIADPFTDESGVDTGASENATYDAGSDLYSPSVSVSLGSNVSGATGTNIGNMTASAGVAAAFDGNTATVAALASAGGYVGKTYSGGRNIYQAFVTPGSSGFDGSVATSSITLTLYGKNGTAPTNATDGAIRGTTGSFTDVNNVTNTKTIVASDPGVSYDHHWVAVTSSNNASNIAELVFSDADILIDNMTLVSEPFAAVGQPDVARFAIQVIENEAATANTDFTAEISRDGGTTWTLATLAIASESGGAKLYEDSEINISAQPSGTSMLWRAKTLTNKDIDMSGVVLQWQ